MDRCDSCRYQNDFEFHACHICGMERDMYKPKRTNADRIRAMTDEGLADFLAGIVHDACCASTYLGDGTYIDSWDDWLKQEDDK